MPGLRIQNSLSGNKETFEPLQPGKVRLYVCGITVYDHLHLGHARMLVVFDAVVRHLRASGYQITYVRNITDVDDKIIQRAAERGESPAELAERYTRVMQEDCAALDLLSPDREPRATTHMPDIVAMIETLMEKGYAYAPGNGDVYYDVSRFEGYGKLSGKRPGELRAGARVAVEAAKDDPLDFALWKAAAEGEPSWPSPWGEGRPGWHIECSAMSTHCLGSHFDIHGGGLDLQFPHHENEIAQSEAATGEHFVNYWMHNGFVQVGGEKMAKSLGNFRTLRDVLQTWQAEEVRYFILGSHYRSPLIYTGEALDNARSSLQRLYTALRGLEGGASADIPADEPWSGRWQEAMDDDFNTPVALSVLFELAREVNRLRRMDPERASGLAALLRQLGGRAGLLQKDPESFFKQGASAAVDAEKIESLVAEREQARIDKDFARADRIRDQLTGLGVRLEDKPEGTIWSVGH